jgi:hypothetical protein
VFGRIDLSINNISIKPKDMVVQEDSPPASIHVNKRIDEKRAMSKTAYNVN